MPENRVLKYNEANVQRQKEVSKQHANVAGKNKKSSASKAKKGESSTGVVAAATTPTAQLTSSSSTSSLSKEKDANKDTDSRASTPSKDLTTKDQPLVPSATQCSSISSTSLSGNSGATTATPTAAVKEATTEALPIDAKTTSSSSSASGGNSSSRRSVANSKPSGDASAPAEGPRKKRGRLDPTIETEEQFMSKVEVKIKIPDELKPWLVDDWDAITRQHKLVELPTKTTVQEIIDNYVQYKKASKTLPAQKEPQILEVANGLVEYFNVTLGSQLLYKFERPQYAEIVEKFPNRPMSTIYGAVHLLRLFIKLGSMLAFTALDEKTIQLLLVHIHDFLKYLVKNSSMYFSMNHFINSTPEYNRKSL